MIDVTPSMQSYRECTRHLWNVAFLPTLTPADDWDLVEEFDGVRVQLFKALVLRAIRRTPEIRALDRAGPEEPLTFLRVVPKSEWGCPVHINRETKRSGYWDHPVDRLGPNDADLRFIDFFDFDNRAARDFEYCLVRIVASGRFPNIVGRDALMSMNYVKIVALVPEEASLAGHTASGVSAE